MGSTVDVDEVSYPGRILFWLAHPRGVGYFEVSLVVYLVDKGGVGHFFWLGWPWGGRILEKWVGYFVNIPCICCSLPPAGSAEEPSLAVVGRLLPNPLFRPLSPSSLSGPGQAGDGMMSHYVASRTASSK